MLGPAEVHLWLACHPLPRCPCPDLHSPHWKEPSEELGSPSPSWRPWRPAHRIRHQRQLISKDKQDVLWMGSNRTLIRRRGGGLPERSAVGGVVWSSHEESEGPAYAPGKPPCCRSSTTLEVWSDWRWGCAWTPAQINEGKHRCWGFDDHKNTPSQAERTQQKHRKHLTAWWQMR